MMVYFKDRQDLVSRGLKLILDGEDVGERCTGFDLETGEVELLLLRNGGPYLEIVEGEQQVAKEIRSGKLELHLTRLPHLIIWPETTIFGAMGKPGVHFTPEQEAKLSALPPCDESGFQLPESALPKGEE